MNRKFDYDRMEVEYIRGEMSLRELARIHGMANHSLLVVQSKSRNWVQKREDFRRLAADKAFVEMADEEARRRAKEMRVRDNAIEAIDEAISKMRDEMKMKRQILRGGQIVEEPLFVMKPADIALLIDRLNVLFGRPSTINEERSLGINLSAGGTIGPDILRGIVEATRGLAPGDAERSPIPRIGGTREN